MAGDITLCYRYLIGFSGLAVIYFFDRRLWVTLCHEERHTLAQYRDARNLLGGGGTVTITKGKGIASITRLGHPPPVKDTGDVGNGFERCNSIPTPYVLTRGGGIEAKRSRQTMSITSYLGGWGVRMEKITSCRFAIVAIVPRQRYQMGGGVRVCLISMDVRA